MRNSVQASHNTYARGATQSGDLFIDCEHSLYISWVQPNPKTWVPGFDSFAHLRDKLERSTVRKGTASSLVIFTANWGRKILENHIAKTSNQK